jgi:hypothetical protein
MYNDLKYLTKSLLMDYMSKDFEEKCSQEIEESIKGRYEEENE